LFSSRVAFASPAALVFVIRWLICGVALMLRRRQPTVVAQHPPSASFDATHPLISLFHFHFSRRERAATQAATSARNAPPAPKTKKEARSATASGGVCRAQAHSTRSWSFWPSPGQIKLRLCRTTAWFWVLRVAFTECPSVARDLGRSTSNSTNPSQPSPTIGPSLTPPGRL